MAKHHGEIIAYDSRGWYLSTQWKRYKTAYGAAMASRHARLHPSYCVDCGSRIGLRIVQGIKNRCYDCALRLKAVERSEYLCWMHAQGKALHAVGMQRVTTPQAERLLCELDAAFFRTSTPFPLEVGISANRKRVYVSYLGTFFHLDELVDSSEEPLVMLALNTAPLLAEVDYDRQIQECTSGGEGIRWDLSNLASRTKGRYYPK